MNTFLLTLLILGVWFVGMLILAVLWGIACAVYDLIALYRDLRAEEQYRASFHSRDEEDS